MLKKLKCVIVDDDPLMHDVVGSICKGLDYIEIVANFECPRKFLDIHTTFDYDVCLLKIFMQEMDGFTVAKNLRDKLVVFTTAIDAVVPDALAMSPVDVLLKPLSKERLDKAVRKAYYMTIGEKTIQVEEDKDEYGLFWVAELFAKVKLPLADIVYVKTDEIDPRNKLIRMKDGKEYTLMDYSMEKLIEHAPHLVQVNRSEAISHKIVNDIEVDIVTLKNVNGIEVAKPVNLSRAFKKKFFERMRIYKN
jgi:DNA-binding LytR/AlgR family response regulator